MLGLSVGICGAKFVETGARTCQLRPRRGSWMPRSSCCRSSIVRDVSDHASRTPVKTRLTSVTADIVDATPTSGFAINACGGWTVTRCTFANVIALRVHISCTVFKIRQNLPVRQLCRHDGSNDLMLDSSQNPKVLRNRERWSVFAGNPQRGFCCKPMTALTRLAPEPYSPMNQ
jgi:hypothetical protein